MSDLNIRFGMTTSEAVNAAVLLGCKVHVERGRRYFAFGNDRYNQREGDRDAGGELVRYLMRIKRKSDRFQPVVKATNVALNEANELLERNGVPATDVQFFGEVAGSRMRVAINRIHARPDISNTCLNPSDAPQNAQNEPREAQDVPEAAPMPENPPAAQSGAANEAQMTLPDVLPTPTLSGTDTVSRRKPPGNRTWVVFGMDEKGYSFLGTEDSRTILRPGYEGLDHATQYDTAADAHRAKSLCQFSGLFVDTWDAAMSRLMTGTVAVYSTSVVATKDDLDVALDLLREAKERHRNCVALLEKARDAVREREAEVSAAAEAVEAAKAEARKQMDSL